MSSQLFFQETWAVGLFLASLHFFAISLVCYLRLIAALFRHREYLVGVLLAAFFLVPGGGWVIGSVVGLCVGWRYSREWNIRGWLIVWSVALGIGAVDLALVVWLKDLSLENWRGLLQLLADK